MLAHYALLVVCTGCPVKTMAVIDFYPDLENSSGYIINDSGKSIGCEIKPNGLFYCLDNNLEMYEFRPVRKLKGAEI